MIWYLDRSQSTGKIIPGTQAQDLQDNLNIDTQIVGLELSLGAVAKGSLS